MAVSTPLLIASFLSTANASTSGARPLATPVAAGSVLVAMAVGNGGVHTFGVSDSKGHTWTAVPISRITSGSQNSSQIFWTVVTSDMTTSDTVTITRSTASALAAHVYALTGVDVATPLGNTGVTPLGNSSTTDKPLVAAMTVADGDLAIGFACTQDNQTIQTVDNGFTLTHDELCSATGAARRSIGIHRQATGAGSFTPALDMNVNGAWSMTGIVFAAAPPPEPEPPTTPWFAITSEGLVPLEFVGL